MSTTGGSDSGRRKFFHEAMRRAVGPVANYLEQRLAPQEPPSLLRPPGAIQESAFLQACEMCGSCIDMCPANAIFPLGSGAAAGTPIIDPSKSPCVVCDGLLCTHACPSGALLPINDAKMIRMGVAEVYDGACLRSNDEPCTECVDRCPFGAEAILFVDDGPPRVVEDGCTGCGVCQFHCPTSPKAIVVAARTE